MIHLLNNKINEHSKIPLVLLKGRVLYGNEGTIWCCANCENVTIWPVHNKTFRLFVHLKSHYNEIKIGTGEMGNKDQTEKTVQIYFQPSQKMPYFLRIVYLVCDDNNSLFENGLIQNCCGEISSATRRIAVSMLLIQAFFSETLPGGQTFALEYDNDNLPLIHVFKLKEKIQKLWSFEEKELWDYVANQIMMSNLFDDRCKFVAFCSFTRRKRFKESVSELGKVFLGGGGLALIGSADLHTWPSELNQDQLYMSIKTQTLPDVSREFSLSFGACVHEIGHIFEAAHVPLGLMGTDYEQIQNFFCPEEKPLRIRWWSLSAQIILANHKWLHEKNALHVNQRKECFRFISNFLKSIYGCIIIEYRDKNNYVIKNEEFTLPAKSVLIKNLTKATELFAMDLYGNFFKYTFQND